MSQSASIGIRLKSGTKANLANAGVRLGEPKFLTDTNELYIGNGTTNVCVGSAQNAYSSIRKIKDYLYELSYDTLDQDLADAYFEKRYKYPPTAIPRGARSFFNQEAFCSSVRNGNYFGRNMDGTYTENAEFVIRTPAAQGRHAVIGIQSHCAVLSNEFVENRTYSELYKIIPFGICDGINDAGVVCSTNIVPVPESPESRTSGTNPTASKSLCSLQLPRYVLDNFATAKAAAEDLRDNVNVWCPDPESDFHYENHFLIADATDTYLVEFYNNAVEITKLETTGRKWITNFRIHGAEFDDENLVVRSSVDPYGNGLERSDLIAANYSTASTLAGMKSLMLSLKYTKTYATATSPFWYSEYVEKDGDYGDLRLDDANYPANLADAIVGERAKYLSRSRDPESAYYGSWQTVHTAIYDIPNLKLWLVTQEADSSTGIEFGIEADAYVRYDVEQNLTDAQKVQARKNIGLSEEGVVQSDWTEEDTTADSYIKNKPGKKHIITIDDAYITAHNAVVEEGVLKITLGYTENADISDSIIFDVDDAVTTEFEKIKPTFWFNANTSVNTTGFTGVIGTYMNKSDYPIEQCFVDIGVRNVGTCVARQKGGIIQGVIYPTGATTTDFVGVLDS